MGNPLDSLGSVFGSSKSSMNIKIPSFSLNGGFKNTGVSSLGEITGSVIQSAQNLMQGARLIYCLGYMMVNPEMWLGVLSIMANNILAVATQMATRLADLIRGQLTQALSQITGAITNLVGNIFSFLSAVVDLIKAIANAVSSLFNMGEIDWSDFMAEEDCEYIFAAMAACMLNKLLGNKLQDLERKISGEIIKTGSELNSAIAENLADVNTVSSYVERQTFLMNKATKQLNGLANLSS